MRTLRVGVTMVARSLSSSKKERQQVFATDTAWRTVTLEIFVTFSDAIEGRGGGFVCTLQELCFLTNSDRWKL